MRIDLASAAVTIFLIPSWAFCGDDIAIEGRLKKAKDRFLKESQSARNILVASLQEKKAAAIKKGELARVKQIAAEADAFSKESRLPTVVPTHSYIVKMRSAGKDLLAAYADAIRSYTMQENLSRASELQKEASVVQSTGSLYARRVFKYADGQFVLQSDGRWLESIVGGKSFHYTEVSRTSEYVELKGEASPISLRLYRNRFTIRKPKGKGFQPFKDGKWIIQHGITK